MFRQWVFNGALTSGQTKLVLEGYTTSGTPASVPECCYITWGFIADKQTVLRLVGYFDFAAQVDLLNVTVGAGVYHTPYSLASPYNNTGVFVLTRPSVYFVLTDSSASNHTYTRLWAKAW